MKERLKEVRKYLKLSQKEMAEELGVPVTAISKYEIGRVKPASDMLIKINHKFKINLNWLLTGEGEMIIDRNSLLIPFDKIELKEISEKTIPIEEINKAIEEHVPEVNIYFPENKKTISLKKLISKLYSKEKKLFYKETIDKIIIDKDNLEIQWKNLKTSDRDATEEAEGKEKPPLKTSPVSTPYTEKCPHISGNAACGRPFTITDNIVEGYKGYPDDIEIPDFCITARGSSMLEHGIKPGSICFIKKVPPSNYDIAAICIYDNGDVYPVLKEIRFKNGLPEFYDGKGEKVLFGKDIEVDIVGKVVHIATTPKKL